MLCDSYHAVSASMCSKYYVQTLSYVAQLALPPQEHLLMEGSPYLACSIFWPMHLFLLALLHLWVGVRQ